MKIRHDINKKTNENAIFPESNAFLLFVLYRQLHDSCINGVKTSTKNEEIIRKQPAKIQLKRKLHLLADWEVACNSVR